MELLDTLDQWDRSAFLVLNDLHAPWMDEVMYLISSRVFWIPFYLLLAYVIYKRKGLKGLLWVLGAAGLLILLCDQTASGLLKPWVGRFRPCQPESGLAGVHIVHGHCGGIYGFVSSHAANFFGLATFFSAFFKQKRLTWIFFGVAILTAYSRIYLGVHYPGDVLGGACVGLIWGGTVAWAYRELLKRRQKEV